MHAADYCREMESRMTAEEIRRACDKMRASGWGYGTTPPAWCWAMVFNEVLAERVADE